MVSLTGIYLSSPFSLYHSTTDRHSPILYPTPPFILYITGSLHSLKQLLGFEGSQFTHQNDMETDRFGCQVLPKETLSLPSHAYPLHDGIFLPLSFCSGCLYVQECLPLVSYVCRNLVHYLRLDKVLIHGSTSLANLY